VIVFRHTDPRYPFLWQNAAQPAARWHGLGDGPAHYFADTPDGAWAEFLRHEGITNPADLGTVRRVVWAVEVPDAPLLRPELSGEVLVGGLDTYPACQGEARRLRGNGAVGLTAPSAALLPGGASGFLIQTGLVPAPARDGNTVVLFGLVPHPVGWKAAVDGRPPDHLLAHVRQL
jgi:RES domain